MSATGKSIPISSSSYPSTIRSPFGSHPGSSPLAQEAIARDMEEDSDDSDDSDDDDAPDARRSSSSDEEPDALTLAANGAPSHSMAATYRRPSHVAYGAGRSTVTPQLGEASSYEHLTKREKLDIPHQARSLLRDSHLAPPKHPDRPPPSPGRWKQWFFGARRRRPSRDEESVAAQADASEVSALLPGRGASETPRARRQREDRVWEEAVAAGRITTTWRREATVLARYSSPLVVTFLLQYSLTVASIFTVGHIGKIELGAVSLASMTANITGYAVYHGLATSLDTLCAQAYGSGNKRLVGLQLQRMLWFLWLLTIPIGCIWLFAEPILRMIIPEARSAELAGLYLKILLAGAPGYAAFESGKRFVQAQGLFSATTYVLLVAAPLNALLNYLFVWELSLGFVGAPIAVAITDNLLPLFLWLYVIFVDGRECWGGFTKKAWRNWGPMIKLALPGLVMVEAEFLAFEILTLASSYISTTHLAAQSILSTITAMSYNIPFPISIAASTRIANLTGASLSEAAKTSGKVALVTACLVGLFNVTLLSSLRNYVPQLFTSDAEVIALVAKTLPLCAAFQLFDALAACCNGLLRGLGRQEIGGYTNLFCYYAIAMPISFGTAFGLGWGMFGLWSGVALALGLVAAIEGVFLYRTNWEDAVVQAQHRNANA